MCCLLFVVCCLLNAVVVLRFSRGVLGAVRGASCLVCVVCRLLSLA